MCVMLPRARDPRGWMTRRREAAMSTSRIVAEALDRWGAAIVPPALRTSLSAHRSDTDVWAILAGELELADFRPTLASDVEVQVFRLRWGNDYAMVANPARLIHFQLEVWRAAGSAHGWDLDRRRTGSSTSRERATWTLEPSPSTRHFLAKGGVPRTTNGRRGRDPRRTPIHRARA